jgi:hypothetical protein
MVMKALVSFSVLKCQLKHPRLDIMNFCVANFHHFAKNIVNKEYYVDLFFLIAKSCKKLP